MRLLSLNRKSARNLITAMLVVAMLCAQWAGLDHRIMHAEKMHSHGLQRYNSPALVFGGLHAGEQQDSALADSHIDDHSRSDEDSHACFLFDAAALGASIHSTPFQSLPLPSIQVLALWTAFVSWQSPFTCHFSSRAPPRIQ